MTVTFELSEAEYHEAVRAIARGRPDWFRPLTTAGLVGCSLGLTLSMINPGLLLATVPLALLGFFVMTYPWLRVKSATDDGWREHWATAGPVALEVSADGLAVRATNVDARYAWAAFGRTDESRGLFLIYRTKDQPLVVPKRALAGVDEVRALRSLLATHVPGRAKGFPVTVRTGS